MKIVKLKGGLGNQLFQYAFAKYVERETGDMVKIDLSAYDGLDGDNVRKPRICRFDLSLPIAAKKDVKKSCLLPHGGNSQSDRYRIGLALEALLNRKYYFERSHRGIGKEQLRRISYFDGYWQDSEMVDSVMDSLREEWKMPEKLSERANGLLEQIRETESVFVGIRRGDYLSVKPEHYGSFGQDYYDRAMKILCEKVKDPVFYIFSNDIEWVRKNMVFSDKKVVYITDTKDDFEDFVMMSQCKHSIIPNSTFHWWGARFNEYPGKVIVAPKMWFADGAPIKILPERWERA